MRPDLLIAFVLVFHVGSSPAAAQGGATASLVLRSGRVEPGHETRYLVSPEIQASRFFIRHAESRLSSGAGLYWAFWSDGDERRGCFDCTERRYRTHILGVRFMVSMDDALLPVVIQAGLSRHLIRARTGDEAVVDDLSYTAAEAGARISTRVYRSLRAGLGAIGYLPLTSEHRPASAGVSISVGYEL